MARLALGMNIIAPQLIRFNHPNVSIALIQYLIIILSTLLVPPHPTNLRLIILVLVIPCIYYSISA